eukprot:gene22182-29244_t
MPTSEVAPEAAGAATRPRPRHSPLTHALPTRVATISGRDSESAQAAPDDSDEKGTNADMSGRDAESAQAAPDDSDEDDTSAGMSVETLNQPRQPPDDSDEDDTSARMSGRDSESSQAAPDDSDEDDTSAGMSGRDSESAQAAPDDSDKDDTNANISGRDSESAQAAPDDSDEDDTSAGMSGRDSESAQAAPDDSDEDDTSAGMSGRDSESAQAAPDDSDEDDTSAGMVETLNQPAAPDDSDEDDTMPGRDSESAQAAPDDSDEDDTSAGMSGRDSESAQAAPDYSDEDETIAGMSGRDSESAQAAPENDSDEDDTIAGRDSESAQAAPDDSDKDDTNANISGRDSESAQAAPDDSDEEGTNAGMSVNPSRAALTARSPSFFGTVRADMSLNPSRAALTARSPSFFGTVRALVQSGHSMGRHDSVKEQRAPAALFVEFDDEQTGKLVEALKEGNVEKCRMAIAAHANPNQSIADAVTWHVALHIAALLGRTISSAKKVYNDDVAAELAGQLVKAGGRAVAEDELGYTPVHLAAYSGASLTLHVILDSIAKSKRVAARLINKQDTQIHYTPLHCAVEGRVASTVLALLLRGADTQLKDSTGFTAWNLAATFNTTWAYQLLMSLCMDMAQGRQVPPDALMQLALEMRQLEVVPMLIRATAKWPERVWSLLHAAIASGIQEFVELIVEDIPRLTPTALLHCPWQDVMLELASRFPDCFKQLMHGLDIVSFEDVVIPFVDRLTMRLIERGEEAGEGEEEEASKGGALHKQESMEHVVSPQLANRQKSAVNRSMLQLFNLKSFLGSDSIASRNVPRAVVAASSGLEESEKIKTLSVGPILKAAIASRSSVNVYQVVGPILKAAIASRSSVNVYQVVTAIDKWLQRNTHCYLDELDVDNIQKLAKLYPDACTLLLSIKFQDKVQIKVPSSLLSSGELAYRGSNISQAFVWQDASFAFLLALGLTVDQIERWVIQNIGFELLIKVFQSFADYRPMPDEWRDIDYC